MGDESAHDLLTSQGEQIDFSRGESAQVGLESGHLVAWDEVRVGEWKIVVVHAQHRHDEPLDGTVLVVELEQLRSVRVLGSAVRGVKGIA